MSVIPDLSPSAIARPHAYVAVLRDALVTLTTGNASVSTKFGGEFLTFRAEHTGELRREIKRMQIRIAAGQFGARNDDPDDMPPRAPIEPVIVPAVEPVVAIEPIVVAALEAAIAPDKEKSNARK
jgi:hypothetical protein